MEQERLDAAAVVRAYKSLSQVVTGVGFLGAGTIMRIGPSVRGLTTAASIWLVAAVGMAAGAGMYILAVVTTGLALVIVHYFPRGQES